LSLVGFLCALNFTGFSEDTVIFDKPLLEQQIDIQISPQLTAEISPNNVFRQPGQKNPKLAGWLSTALPGAGQIYNGQWWKVPVIYGGAGALFYFGNFNKTQRDIFQKEYRGRVNYAAEIDTNFIRNPKLTAWGDDQLLNARNYYRRNLELIYVFSGLLYILNIVDAVVFAHLATFDVSENLTIHVQPFASPDLSPYAFNSQVPMRGGLRLTFTLK
jgi:hypothetical protein